jgi:hypothetical protein
MDTELRCKKHKLKIMDCVECSKGLRREDAK